MVAVFIISFALTILCFAGALDCWAKGRSANFEFLAAVIGAFATLIIAAIKVAN